MLFIYNILSIITFLALMCSGAMGLPVSSFPNMSAICLEDGTGQAWLSVNDFLTVGMVGSVIAYVTIVTVGYGIMHMIQFN